MHPEIELAQQAAITVLLHNSRGPFDGLPRTAGWGYPEPYTRDLLIGCLGVMASGNQELIRTQHDIMEALAKHQSPLGQIPSLVHDPENRGASDTTPLFLLTLGMLRAYTGDASYLDATAERALTWMSYQSVDDRQLIGQQPTSDWRDEQWVLGYGLYVNSLVHGYLLQLGDRRKAAMMRAAGRDEGGNSFVCRGQPSYAIWFYKELRDSRCDVLGNSLAILTGFMDSARAQEVVGYIESRCATLQANAELKFNLPPCLIPVIHPTDRDWHARYETYNQPGHYHNGGVWPFVCGFYVAALTAAGEHQLAEEKLLELAALVKPSRKANAVFPAALGFNEWFSARDGAPMGEDWQSWSASMFLYAAACVSARRALFFPTVD